MAGPRLQRPDRQLRRAREELLAAYDSPAPSLAPLYDLVSTAVYDELTTRLAMSIDGATHLDEVDSAAWERLAKDVGFAPRFLDQRMDPFVARVLAAATDLSALPEHADPTVKAIASQIARAAA